MTVRRFRKHFTPRVVEVNGHKFASLAEGRRYGELNLACRTGAIRDLKVHPRLPMVINGVKIGRGWFEADFSYLEHRDGAERLIYEDVKGGGETDNQKTRRQVAEAVNRVTIEIVQR